MIDGNSRQKKHDLEIIDNGENACMPDVGSQSKEEYILLQQKHQREQYSIQMSLLLSQLILLNCLIYSCEDEINQ